MTFNAIKQAIYGLYLTNSFGFRLRNKKDPMEIKRLRLAYSNAQLKTLNITVNIENEEKLPEDGQYLVVINHRSIIDPPITEVALNPFKEGARIIALKNRINILPLYIKTNANLALENALNDKHLKQEVTLVVGDIIDYKDKTPLEENYRKCFDLDENLI